MTKTHKTTLNSIAGVMITSLFAITAHAHADKLQLSSPLFVQKLKLTGPEISPYFPVTAQCSNCLQIYKINDITYINYAQPTDTDTGTLTYVFYTGDYDNRPVCGYSVSIPFAIDKSGNFTMTNNHYAATLHPLSDKGCEKHGETNVTTVGDTINLGNSVLQ